MKIVLVLMAILSLAFVGCARVPPTQVSLASNTSQIEFTKITAPLSLNGQEPGTELPWGSVVYHWANGITECYGPDNNRIFVAKDAEAADIAHPTPSRGGGSPSPATHMYQVPNGARVDTQAMVGRYKATKIYMGDTLIMTVIDKSEDFLY